MEITNQMPTGVIGSRALLAFIPIPPPPLPLPRRLKSCTANGYVLHLRFFPFSEGVEGNGQSEVGAF